MGVCQRDKDTGANSRAKELPTAKAETVWARK